LPEQSGATADHDAHPQHEHHTAEMKRSRQQKASVAECREARRPLVADSAAPSTL
jgi:hypothetical protein